MPPRTTLAAPTAELRGIGLFTGAPGAVRIAPAESGGVVFTRTDRPGTRWIPATIDHIVRDLSKVGFPAGMPVRNSVLASPDAAAVILTVEHILSALVGMGITDATIEVEGPEVPIGDGSAQAFAELIGGAGTRQLSTTIEPLRPREPITVEDSRGGRIDISPLAAGDDHATYEYRLDYGPDSPLKAHTASWRALGGGRGGDSYQRSVAPARTFSLRAEAEAARAAGLFKNFSPRDLLVIGDDGDPIENAWRMADEPAMHKVLDLIGDLALIGRPLAAKVVATKSGHALAHEACRALLAAV